MWWQVAADHEEATVCRPWKCREFEEKLVELLAGFCASQGKAALKSATLKVGPRGFSLGW